MAKTMMQRQTEAEISMAEIKKDIGFIKDALTENNKQHTQIITKIDAFIEAAPEKFASKEEMISTKRKIKALEIAEIKRKIFTAKIAGGAIVIFFILQLILKHYGLL